jgi:hypothetical protein
LWRSWAESWPLLFEPLQRYKLGSPPACDHAIRLDPFRRVGATVRLFIKFPTALDAAQNDPGGSAPVHTAPAIRWAAGYVALATPAGVVGPRGKAAVKRYNVYRSNVTIILIDALAHSASRAAPEPPVT